MFWFKLLYRNKRMILGWFLSLFMRATESEYSHMWVEMNSWNSCSLPRVGIWAFILKFSLHVCCFNKQTSIWPMFVSCCKVSWKRVVNFVLRFLADFHHATIQCSFLDHTSCHTLKNPFVFCFIAADNTTSLISSRLFEHHVRKQKIHTCYCA